MTYLIPGVGLVTATTTVLVPGCGLAFFTVAGGGSALCYWVRG